MNILVVILYHGGRKEIKNEFEIIANFDYDSGYGWPEIPENLIVYFKDGTYIFRNEYDGSEWWECVVKKNLLRKMTHIHQLII